MFRSLLGIVSLSALGLTARNHGKGKGKGHDDDRREAAYFRREDYAAVQRYYAGPRDLPPRLQKKYYRTGKLPPGWESKMRPFPPELVRVLPPRHPIASEATSTASRSFTIGGRELSGIPSS